MSKPYDAVAKDLLELDPVAWAALLGVPRSPAKVKLVDSELSTVTTAADKVIVIKDRSPWIIDIEFQSWSDTTAPRQLLKYNALLQDRHELPVASVLVVLRESANSTAYTGRLPVAAPLGPAWEFGYTVLKVWETPAESLLTGPLALVPLAPVANLGTADVATVLERAVERTNREADPDMVGRMLSAVGILLQGRYGTMTTESLLERYPELQDFVVFRMHRANEARSIVLRMGRKKFGDPTPEQEAALKAIKDVEALETLSERLLDVNSWEDLLKPV